MSRRAETPQAGDRPALRWVPYAGGKTQRVIELRQPPDWRLLVSLLFGLADDINLLAGVHQLQTLADFQFLFIGIVSEPLDALPLPLDVLRQGGIPLLHELDLPVFF